MKCAQDPGGFAQFPLRCLSVDLNNFLTGNTAGVLNLAGDSDHIAGFHGTDIGYGEGRITQTIAERIDDLLGCTGDGFKIPITIVNIIIPLAFFIIADSRSFFKDSVKSEKNFANINITVEIIKNDFITKSPMA